MLTQISRRITATVLSGDTDAEQRTVYEYGCELWLYTVISTLSLLVIGAFLDAFLPASVMIFFFYILQSNGGGYHATSHLRCFLTMTAGLIFGIMLIRLPLSSNIYVIILIVSTIILLTFPLQLHAYKKYLSNRSAFFKNRSRVITLILTISMALAEIAGFTLFARAGAVAFLLSAVSRVSVAFLHKH